MPKIENDQERKRSWWEKRGPVTVAGALSIGISCSVLYDALLKPGISAFGEQVTALLTFGSQRLTDAPFARAALDPTAIPSLVILLTVVASFTFYMIFTTTKAVLLVRRQTGPEGESKNRIDSAFEYLFQRSNLLIFIYCAALVTNVTIVLMIFTSFNKSVLIWRAFHSDLTLIAPYIDEQAEEVFKARFAAMRRKSEYILILENLESIASSNKIELGDFIN